MPDNDPNTGETQVDSSVSTPAGADKAAQTDAKAANGQAKIVDQPLSTATLQGILKHRDEQSKISLDRLQQSFNDKVANLAKTIEDLGSKLTADANKGPKKTAESGVEDPELINMRRQIKEQQDEVSRLRSTLEKTTRDAQSYKRRTAIVDALTRAKCVRPEQCFEILDKVMQENPETGELYAVADLGEALGKTNLGLDEYIKQVFSEDPRVGFPEAFPGKLRPGSPAGGDGAAGGAKFDFTIEDFQRDPTLYSRFPEKARAAFEKGRVKGASANSNQPVGAR